MKSKMLLLALCAFLTVRLGAEPPGSGSVAGTVVEPTSGQGVEFATVVIRPRSGGNPVRTGATNAKGDFILEGIPAGDYELVYGLVGGAREAILAFALNSQHPAVDLGRLPLGGDTAVKLAQVEVTARREAFSNSIDRKVYNVGKDIQSVAGSASDLLQNVPAVQVDIEGNVSLRGDSNVLILINGKSSTMMGRNRAAVLEQMPADGISKIEVITNPSAKYKPDGTAGIINLTLKTKPGASYSGSVRVAAGNNRRANASVTASATPGKYTLFATAAVRQDDRQRTVQDERTHLDLPTGRPISTSQYTTEDSRPLTRLAQTGVDYQLSEQTKVGGNARYNYRDLLRHATVTSLTRDASGTLTGEADRRRVDPEYEADLEFSTTLQHAFAAEGHELNLEVKHSKTTEQEDNRYTNITRLPSRPVTLDNELIRYGETCLEGTIDYTHPLGEKAKLEAGYGGEHTQSEQDFYGSAVDATTGAVRVDPARSNRFLYDGIIHAFYGTYGRKFASFGALAGLRFEAATIDTHQVTTGLLSSNRYRRFYPSLHLSYDLTPTQQLQLNYSHRVHRPEGDDLNPYPEYQDPFNLRAGNPKLLPEDIHSIEAGWQYKHDDTTYLATAYYRQRYHGFTDVSRYIDGTTLLTTKENLGRSQSGGLELGANTRLRDRLALNFSANAYRNEIDASNLGFTSRRAAFAWDAKLNATFDVSKATLVQFNTNYTAKRLTPQGYRLPTKVANLGLRHNFSGKKYALILTVSDLFASLHERTHIDTPLLHQDITRRRSTRIAYVSFIYNFGRPAKKPKKDDLQFDNSL